MTRNERRVDSYEDRMVSIYEYDGGAARELSTQPEKQRIQRKKVNHAAARARAVALSRGYVFFLAVICIFVSVWCVLFIRQKSTVTTQYESIAALESEYSKLKSNNDAKYNQVMDSVSLETVKDAAENRLGMHYASADQIIYYDLTDDSYVRQYKDVPTD